MNELPAHVLLKILDSLPSVDAIRCRVVCKSWLALIDRFVLDELNVFYGQRQYTKFFQLQKCFLNRNRSISFDETSFNRLVIWNEQFGHLFRNLKKFSFQHVFEHWPDYRKIEKLINSFKNLEHLYLAGTPLLSIKLKKLKTLDCSRSNVQEVAPKGRKIILDCPELQALAIDWKESKAPVLNCPKLRYLKYVHYIPWVSQLDSLEVLNLRELETSSEGIVRNHPKLHTLNIFTVGKAVLEELVRSKRELGRGHLKVFVRSLPVEGEVLEAFDEIFDRSWWHLGYFTAKGVEFYLKHEQEFRDDFFVFGEYEWIIIEKESIANLKLLTDWTPIFRKVRRIHGLDIRCRDTFNHKELIDLMKKMPNAQMLACYDATLDRALSGSGVILDQAFFDQLPTILEFLYSLQIWSDIVWEDLSFMLRFRELQEFLDRQYEFSDENWRVKTAFQKKKAPDFGSSNWH